MVFLNGMIVFTMSLIMASFGTALPIESVEAQPFHVDFFKNSTRREPTESETQSVAKLLLLDDKNTVQKHCTSFFVANSKNSFYMATARHCADYQFAKACRDGRIRLEFEGKANNFNGVCKSVVVGNYKNDLIIFDAAFARLPQSKIKSLRLAYSSPPLGTRLTMLGYPYDQFRIGKLTATENCWIHRGGLSVRLADLPMNVQDEIKKKKQGWRARWLQTLLDNQFLHANCSVYGGNSGGPIMIEGTDLVVGLPALYWPGYYEVLPESASMEIESVDHFIKKNRPALEKAGVILLDLDRVLSI